MRKRILVITVLAPLATQRALVFCAATSYHHGKPRPLVYRMHLEQNLQHRWTCIKDKEADPSELSQFTYTLTKALLVPKIAPFEGDMQSYLLHVLMLCYVAAYHKKCDRSFEGLQNEYMLDSTVHLALQEYQTLIQSQHAHVNWDWLAYSSKYWEPPIKYHREISSSFEIIDNSPERLSEDLPHFPLFPELEAEGLMQPIIFPATKSNDTNIYSDFFTYSPNLAPISPTTLALEDDETLIIDVVSCSPERDQPPTYQTVIDDDTEEIIDILTVSPTTSPRKISRPQHHSKYCS